MMCPAARSAPFFRKMRFPDTHPTLSEADIASIVPAFYAKVRQDNLLGPIFEDAVDAWPEHLAKLQDFWSSVMLASGRYKGQPMPAHILHEAQITPAAFARWLELWSEATDALLPPDAAAAMQEKAGRIAEVFALGILCDRQRLVPSTHAAAELR